LGLVCGAAALRANEMTVGASLGDASLPTLTPHSTLNA
jgi:hypothetical protein